jgi:hypothetical protein
MRSNVASPRKLRSVVLWCLFILGGVGFFQPLFTTNSVLAFFASFEAVHIVAHTILYGTLAFLGRRAGLSVALALTITICIGALQEGVQLAYAHRGPGLPELFDICVDAVAASLALLAHRRFASTATPPSPSPAVVAKSPLAVASRGE